FGGFYYGNSTLANALTRSDNAVFAAVGIKVGTKKVAATANRMGIRTPISTNYAMTLGGLKQGVTPLDMAHAYETFAEDGELVTGSLAANDGPVGIKKITSLETGDLIERNKRVEHRAISAKAARISRNLLEGPVKFGTAKLARIPGQVIMGKTGTTENNGDAWFVGFTKKYTVAVWVGYPDSVKSMNIDYFGKEVTGGTFPAAIWRQFMLRMLEIDESRAPKSKKTKQSTLTTGTIPAAPTDTAPAEAETETATTPPAATTTPTPTTTTTPMTPVQPQTGTGPTGGTGTLP
ncbi:MAG TPA: penicillin-binding transpeptidase domain-containing protein, partial [Baekduia sp.]|nr:penicillin-binding transpeptidase domain-containing protein [Baekduia sp.]